MEEGVEITNLEIPAIKGDKGDKGDAGKISSLAVTMLASTATPTVTNTGTVYDAQYVLGIPKGTGVSGTEINDDGELIISLTDGSSINVGVVVGTSVNSVYFTEDYDLVVELTDSTEITAGNLEELLNDILSNYYDKDTADGKFALITETGKTIELSINPTTYVMTLNLKNKAGTVISTDDIDLPLETMVVSASYDSVNKKIVLTLKNGSTIDVPVGDLISGLQTEITSSNKLSSDLVDDTNKTHKFVTASQKTVIDSVETDYAHTLTLGYTASTQELAIGIANHNGAVLDTVIADLSDLARKSYVDDETDKLYEELQEKQEEIDTLHSWLDQTTDTAEGEGKEITLENTLELPLKSITEEGNSEQESTEGKNILTSNNLSEIVRYGVTFTPVYDSNNLLQYVNVNGTFSNEESVSNYGYIIGSYDFKQNEVYTISGVTNLTSNVLQLYTRSDNAFPSGNRLQSYDGKVTRTAQANETCVIAIYIYKGNTYNNVKIYPMVCENNDNDTYEPYTNGQAPNPSYPFPIKSVTGNNNVVVNSKNLYPIARKTFTRADISWVDSNGNILTNATHFNNSNDKFTLKSGTYYLSYSDRTNVTYTQIVKNLNGVVTTIRTDEGSFTLEKDTEVLIRFKPTTANILTDTGKIQVEYGSTATSYQPYQNQTLPLNLGTIELNKIGDYQDYIYKNNGNWYKKEHIKKLILKNLSFTLNTTFTNVVRARGQLSPASISTPNGLCNAFIELGEYSQDIEHFYIQDTGVWLFINKSRLSEVSQNGVNDFIQANNFYAYYVFTNPQDIKITDATLISQLEAIDKTQSYNGTTIITSTYEEGNAQMILKATAYANKVTDTRLNNIEARLALLEE